MVGALALKRLRGSRAQAKGRWGQRPLHAEDCPRKKRTGKVGVDVPGDAKEQRCTCRARVAAGTATTTSRGQRRIV